MYLCNCNGIRERQAHAVIGAGARRPSDIFEALGTKVQCGRCVCDMRALLHRQHEALRQAAE